MQTAEIFKSFLARIEVLFRGSLRLRNKIDLELLIVEQIIKPAGRTARTGLRAIGVNRKRRSPPAPALLFVLSLEKGAAQIGKQSARVSFPRN